MKFQFYLIILWKVAILLSQYWWNYILQEKHYHLTNIIFDRTLVLIASYQIFQNITEKNKVLFLFQFIF